ncbi:MAG: hypothetical protein EKK34_18140 [Mycobacterium sp.]|nr:MAG: hypothetical protein EKK34_18140 [Mycobacterium sp.]
MLATVYRPAARDEHGDPVNADGEIVRLAGDSVAKLGSVDLIIGGASGNYRTVRDAGMRGETISTEGLLGFKADSEIQPRAGDVIEAQGQRWKITGPILWGWGPHALTGRPPRYRWIAAVAN